MRRREIEVSLISKRRRSRRRRKMKKMMQQLARIVSFLSRSSGCSDAF
jgi:Flp pilus assembly protein TadB